MVNRAIVIFPNFSNLQVIDEIREKYDPLYNFISPHLTLIFPFQSELTKNELVEHLENQLRGISPFELIARGVTGASDGYIFLDVKMGNDNMIELHDKLYEGILKSYHNKFIPYIPHITIARIKDENIHRKIVKELSDFDVEFRTVIDKISIEVLDDSEKSILECEFKL